MASAGPTSKDAVAFYPRLATPRSATWSTARSSSSSGRARKADFNADWNCQPECPECNDQRRGQLVDWPLYKCRCHYLHVSRKGNEATVEIHETTTGTKRVHVVSEPSTDPARRIPSRVVWSQPWGPAIAVSFRAAKIPPDGTGKGFSLPLGGRSPAVHDPLLADTVVQLVRESKDRSRNRPHSVKRTARRGLHFHARRVYPSDRALLRSMYKIVRHSARSQEPQYQSLPIPARHRPQRVDGHGARSPPNCGSLVPVHESRRWRRRGRTPIQLSSVVSSCFRERPGVAARPGCPSVAAHVRVRSRNFPSSAARLVAAREHQFGAEVICTGAYYDCRGEPPLVVRLDPSLTGSKSRDWASGVACTWNQYSAASWPDTLC